MSDALAEGGLISLLHARASSDLVLEAGCYIPAKGGPLLGVEL